MENTLLRILGDTQYYDTITVQKSVQALGELKSVAAVERIQKLYRQQSPIPGQIPNALFRMKCLIAVVNTLGADAREFLREVDLVEKDTAIRARLNDYKKQFNY